MSKTSKETQESKDPSGDVFRTETPVWQRYAVQPQEADASPVFFMRLSGNSDTSKA